MDVKQFNKVKDFVDVEYVEENISVKLRTNSELLNCSNMGFKEYYITKAKELVKNAVYKSKGKNLEIEIAIEEIKHIIKETGLLKNYYIRGKAINYSIDAAYIISLSAILTKAIGTNIQESFITIANSLNESPSLYYSILVIGINMVIRGIICSYVILPTTYFYRYIKLKANVYNNYSFISKLNNEVIGYIEDVNKETRYVNKLVKEDEETIENYKKSLHKLENYLDKEIYLKERHWNIYVKLKGLQCSLEKLVENLEINPTKILSVQSIFNLYLVEIMAVTQQIKLLSNENIEELMTTIDRCVVYIDRAIEDVYNSIHTDVSVTLSTLNNLLDDAGGK